MTGHISKLAEFVAETTWKQIPDGVQQHAKLVLLDMLGVILAGADQAEVRKLREGMRPTAGSGATILARGWPTADPATAAFLNGVAGRSIELSEGHRSAMPKAEMPTSRGSQPAAQIIPGLLAAAERAQSSGRDILTALIVAYDLAVRLMTATTMRPLAHSNGQAPLLGAVAAGARARGLDATETSLALRIGVTLVLTPSYTNAVAGATALNVAGGMSGFAAIVAPELALAGFTAQDNAVAEALGNLVGDRFNPAGLLDELGTRWEIRRNYFRLRACCYPIYAALDALEDALARLCPQSDDIERIDIATYRFASLMNNADPPNYFAAKYSLPHAAAALVFRSNSGYASFTEAMVHDRAIAALRHRVHITEDQAMTAALPRLMAARVTLTLKDGRQCKTTCEHPKGIDDERPYQEPEIRGKFRELAGLVLTAEGVDAVEHAIDRCDQWKSLNALTDPLRRYSRPH